MCIRDRQDCVSRGCGINYPEADGELPGPLRVRRRAPELYRNLTQRACLLYTSGIIGYFVLQQAQDWVPYVLVVAASSFLYISVADLMPQMHERVSLADAVPQLLLVGVGVVLILSLLHI